MSISISSFWLILALVLAGSEILSGSFYLLALALGISTGALAAWSGLSVPVQILIAAVSSLISVFLLHYWRKNRLSSPKTDDSLEIGNRVHILQWKDTRHARVQYRGTQWDGELAPDAAGDESEYFITAVKGTILILHHQPPEQN